jgi:hypothetical protein
MTGEPLQRLRLQTAFVGDESTRPEVRAALKAVLSPWEEMLGIDWMHSDAPTADELSRTTFHAILAVPPTATWARARHLAADGPQELRNVHWPWGMPQLSGRNRERVEAENSALRDCIRSLDTAARGNDLLTMAMLFPEDRGAGANGEPASIWQLQELRDWARRLDLRRGAFNQCEVGTASTPRPLGLLFHPERAGDPPKGSPLRAGWPQFSPQPGHHYLGPLPRRCRCGRRHGKFSHHHVQQANIFASGAAAQWVAWLIIKPHLRRRADELGLLRKGDERAQHEVSGFPDGSDTDQTWPEPSSNDEAFDHYQDQELMFDINGDSKDLDLNAGTMQRPLSVTRELLPRDGSESARRSNAGCSPRERADPGTADCAGRGRACDEEPSSTSRASRSWDGRLRGGGGRRDTVGPHLRPSRSRDGRAAEGGIDASLHDYRDGVRGGSLRLLRQVRGAGSLRLLRQDRGASAPFGCYGRTGGRAPFGCCGRTGGPALPSAVTTGPGGGLPSAAAAGPGGDPLRLPR